MLVIVATLIGCTAGPVKYAVRDKVVSGERNGGELIAESHNAAAERNSTGFHVPKLRHAVAPVVPKEVMRRNIEGEVKVQVSVDAQGNVFEISILKSPDPLLSEAVVTAMKEWKFELRTIDGTPQAFTANQTYVFRAEK